MMRLNQMANVYTYTSSDSVKFHIQTNILCFVHERNDYTNTYIQNIIFSSRILLDPITKFRHFTQLENFPFQLDIFTKPPSKLPHQTTARPNRTSTNRDHPISNRIAQSDHIRETKDPSLGQTSAAIRSGACRFANTPINRSKTLTIYYTCAHTHARAGGRGCQVSTDAGRRYRAAFL